MKSKIKTVRRAKWHRKTDRWQETSRYGNLFAHRTKPKWDRDSSDYKSKDWIMESDALGLPRDMGDPYKLSDAQSRASLRRIVDREGKK